MDMAALVQQFPPLAALLRALLKGGRGKSQYRFKLTDGRLKLFGIEATLAQNDEWLQRLMLLANKGWFAFEAKDERLSGSSLVINDRQWLHLQALFDDGEQGFLAQWPALVEAAVLPPASADWLRQHPPPASWASTLNWPLALRRLVTLTAGQEYSAQQIGAYLYCHAKALDNASRAQDWNAALGQQFGWRLVERRLLLHAHLPAGVRRIVLIENQDTYLRLMDVFGDQLGLLFIAGNRAASERLVNRDGCCFGYTARSEPAAIESFEAFWFGDESAEYQLRYWGDLDAEGIKIFQRMQVLLPTLRPWMAAYQAMAALQPNDARPGSLRGDPSVQWVAAGDVHQEAVLNFNQLEWD